MTNVYVALGFLALWVILFIYASIVLVKTGSIGVVFRFRKFVRVLEPGLNFIIPLIERVERYSTQTHQFELPDEPEKIDREHNIAAQGMKLPFRIPHKGMLEAVYYTNNGYDVTTRQGDPFAFDNDVSMNQLKRVRFSELPDSVQEALRADSLNEPLTSEPRGVIEWNLPADRDAVENFISNMSGEEGRSREEEVRKRAEDQFARALNMYQAPATLGHAIFMAPIFDRLLKKQMEDVVTNGEKPWGVNISNAYIKEYNAGETVNKARSRAGAAASDAQASRRATEAKAYDIVKQATANKDAEIKKGEGEAGRIKAMVEVMSDNNARFIATLDVAERALTEGNNKIIMMPSDLGAIGGILALGGEVSRKQEDEKKGGEPKK